jgi:hypothetical protein
MEQRDRPLEVPANFGRILFAAHVGAGVMLLGTLVIGYFPHPYYWMQFLILPVLGGVAVGLLLDWEYTRPSRNHVAAVTYMYGISGIIMLALAAEGVICLIMAGPLFYLLGYGSVLIVSSLFARSRSKNRQVMVSLLVLLPAIGWYADVNFAGWSYRTVTTSYVIDAPVEAIWPLLSQLERIEPPKNLLLRAGIAHPIATATVGEGVGASRLCVLSTGEMPEVITAWAPPCRLEFKVLETPPSMRETNPFHEVHPSHLEGYYESLEGGFLLERLGPNRSRITGTSRYRHAFGPSVYWSLWTDYIVRSIHVQVFDEMETRVASGR